MEVTDSIFKMLSQGYLMGPLDEEEIPFTDIRGSGVMCKLKPDASARVILNLSKGRPAAVNESIIQGIIQF